MIRRGLQLIAAVGLLGAAPLCFGQAGTTNWPTGITLQDFAEPEVNGFYTLVGELDDDGTRIFQRYSSGGGSPTWWVTLSDVIANNSVSCGVHSAYPTSGVDQRVYISPVTGPEWPASFGSFIGGAPSSAVAILSWGGVALDPYEEAFPDWDSAAVKIPLGFTFGLTFWAVCLAFHAPMRWIRQLADAAS